MCKNDLPKPVTPHYLPKVKESVFVKPHHVIAPGSSRNSQEESYGSNDMAHNHYLEKARKKKQERNRNSKSSVMHTTSLQITTNGSKQKPRSNNQSSRSLPVSKSSDVTSNSVPLIAIGQMSSLYKSSSMHEKPNTPRSCLRSGSCSCSRVADPSGSPLSTTIDQDIPSASTSSTNQKIQSQTQDLKKQLKGVHSRSNYDHLNQSFDTLTKLTKNHPLENVIGGPSRPISTRSQLQEHVIWCYFDANDNPIPFGGKRSLETMKKLADETEELWCYHQPSKEKKQKQDKETTKANTPAKRTKAGKVAKKRTLKRSQQLVDEVVDAGIPLTEPGFGDLEADTQRAVEESLKDAHGAHQGPLPPMVFREPDTGKYQPLPEVEGKGKEKVGAEQAARVLLNLQTPKKKSPTDNIQLSRRLTEVIPESDEEVPPVLGTTRDTLGTTPEGGVLLGPERPRTYDDLKDNVKKQFDADIRATNIVLQGLPKDIYKLINLPQTNNQLRTSSNTRNQATVQEDRIVVQNVQGQQNQNQRNFAQELVQWEMGEHRIELGMPMLVKENRSSVITDKMLLMQAQGKGAVLDEEELIFLADECDAFNSDVDDKPIAQSIFMANFSSTRPTILQVGPLNASILSEAHDLENTIDHCDDKSTGSRGAIGSCHREKSNSNVIPYEQYLTINEVFVEPSCASSVLNDAYVLHDNNAYIFHDPLATELNIYKQQVAMYEQRTKFDLTLSIGAQNPFYLRKAKMVQPALYDGDEILKTRHVPEVIPFFNLLKEHFDEVQRSLVKEVRAMIAIFKNMEAEVDQNVIDKKYGEIERKNLLITNENLIANCIAHDVFYTVIDSALTASRFHDLSNAYNVTISACN
ncbi:hypothetical protein Tco_0548074 [Tanacetum coccineum]